MIRTVSRLLLPLLALGAAQPSLAQSMTAPMAGSNVERRVESLMTQLDWKASRAELELAARKSGKLVFWLQLVGKLDDGL